MIPQLRFPQFTNELQAKKLRDLVEIFDGTHQTPKYMKSGVPFYSVENVTADNFIDTKYVSEEVFFTEKNKPEKGDILMTRIGDIGTARYIDWDARASFYVSLALLKQSNQVNSRYLTQYIKTSIFQRELWKRTIHVAFPKKINLGEIGESSVTIPSKLEQEKIAQFLIVVDERTEKQAKKVELLKNYKKGVMQKIFSQQIRFKDKNGKSYPEWGQIKLGALCKKARSGGTPTATNRLYYTEGTIPFLAISDITEQGKYLIKTTKFINEKGLRNSASWLVPQDSLIYSMYASVGFVSINKIPMATSQAVINLIPNSQTSTEFLYYFLSDYKRKIHRFIETGTQGNLNAQIVKNIPVDLPGIAEQQKIIALLSGLDDRIKIEETCLADVRQWKKGLLQRMLA